MGRRGIFEFPALSGGYSIQFFLISMDIYIYTYDTDIDLRLIATNYTSLAYAKKNFGPTSFFLTLVRVDVTYVPIFGHIGCIDEQVASKIILRKLNSCSFVFNRRNCFGKNSKNSQILGSSTSLLYPLFRHRYTPIKSVDTLLFERMRFVVFSTIFFVPGWTWSRATGQD